ncbi:MAG: ATP-grasp domain-containing protein [Deltaproteobacteria bacterium]|nr:ATP-grasp domain-containing protein [Deltaproteobacteria bacterium]
MFSKVLIANRGLILANCVRAVQELGGKAVAIYETEDENNAGVRNADEAYEIQNSSATRAYADVDQIVKLAKKLKVDAVLSGYGFLSQNAEFIKKLQKIGITTIAPTLEGIHNLSDKPLIRKLAMKLGLYILPGSSNCLDYTEIKKEANTIGYPLMIKATHGYGGKGIRVVERASELRSTYEFIKSQCHKFSMNSNEVYIEKFLPKAHHIEFPVLRDKTGDVAIFPEQWCSVQRRFQKQLVETPSQIITAQKREQLQQVIRKLINKLDICGFASVEFLVDEDVTYFLKVNGYIQPFYTGTSLLTGIDLLKEQIRIFAGHPLSIKSDRIKKNGHVISVSICAEDPDNNFAPSPGKIDRFYYPFGQGINVQTNVFSGDTVATFYDPMIAKVIVRDASRKEAISRMKVALDNFFIDGIKTNIPLMRAILNSEDFRQRNVNISYIPNLVKRNKITQELKNPEDEQIAAIIAALDLHYDANSQQILEAAKEDSLWTTAARWLSQKNRFNRNI